MTPLFKITKKEKEFYWEIEQEKAFQQAKERITTASVLMQFDPEKETTIKIDVSDYTIGMRMIQQGIDRKPQVVTFHL